MAPEPKKEVQQHFTVGRMRSGLGLYAGGKLFSGLIGLAWLLVLVRALELPSYAAYILLLAGLEIVLLLSNAGVYPFAQRYITEARLPQNAHLLGGLIWRSLAFRCLTLVLSALVLVFGASVLAVWLRQPILQLVLPMYSVVLVAEGAIRYLELVFESLLEQASAQLCAIFRNGLRLLLVSVWWFGQGSLSLIEVIKIEMFTSSLGLLLGMALVKRLQAKLPVHQLCSATNEVELARSGGSGPALVADFGWRRLWRFAMPLYLAQCLSQVYSPDMIKLLVSRMLGVAEAAYFGFAHAISFVLQRYLPASLLLGLVRPMLVARQGQQNPARLIAVGNLVLKVNLLLLLPLATVFAVAGADFTGWLSGGRYREAGLPLFLLTLLLVLNGTHLVLAMLATTLENSRAVLWGTVVSVPGVLLGMALVRQMGSTAMVLGLWVSELLWCSFAVMLLRRSGFAFSLDWAAWVKLLGCACLSGATAFLALDSIAVSGMRRLLLASLVIAVLYSILVFLMRPFSSAELASVERLLPARFRRPGVDSAPGTI